MNEDVLKVMRALVKREEEFEKYVRLEKEKLEQEKVRLRKLSEELSVASQVVQVSNEKAEVEEKIVPEALEGTIQPSMITIELVDQWVKLLRSASGRGRIMTALSRILRQAVVSGDQQENKPLPPAERKRRAKLLEKRRKRG